MLMKTIAHDLDHVGVAVRNLDAGRDIFQRLGFQLTVRSHHRGSRAPGAPVEPWGSANHCAMLQRGYLEVIGLTDPAKFSTVKGMLDNYEGAHIVALQGESVDTAHSELRKFGLAVDEPRDLERMAAYGPDGTDSRRVAFRNMYMARSIFTEARLQYTEHLTREVMWQPHLLEHPNGALALSDLFLCSEDVEATVLKLAPVFGVQARQVSQGEHLLRLHHSSIRILTPEAWAEWATEAKLPPLPAPVGLGVQVRSLGATRDHLVRNGFTVQAGRANGIWVGPEQACGAVIYFFDGGLDSDSSHLESTRQFTGEEHARLRL